ncbi:MAG TPA: hypothetical protein VII74_00720 [Chthoniobacterales bacterium]
MTVTVFTLCDFAKAENGKMTIVGTFDGLFAHQAPAVHPMCALAMIMQFERIEEGNKNIRLSFIDTDGKPIMPTINAQMPVRLNPGESIATVQFVVVIQQISLPRFGEYSIDLAVDGRQEASTPLYLRKVPQSGAQLPPPVQES